jgi:hypothetical protein
MMSAHSAGRPPSSGLPDRLLLLISVAAALAGGLAAADIVHPTTTFTLVVCFVVAAAVLAVFWWPSQRQQLPAEQWHEQARSQGPPGLPAGPSGPLGTRTSQEQSMIPGRGTSTPELDGEEGTNAVVQAYPAQPGQPGDSDWWKRGPVPPPAPSADARRAPAPDLYTYLQYAQIAQCPNCGSFALDLKRIPDGSGWGVRCNSCDVKTWAWRPGAPWPPVRVAPTRRRQSHPPS